MINFILIGKRIKSQRKKYDYTQEKLAEMLNISTEHLSRIETGSFRPSLQLIENICEIFNINEEELMFGTQEDIQYDRVLLKKISELSDNKKQALSAIIDLIK